MKKLFKKGFTLVELLVVIAIIAILGTVSVVGYIGFTEDAKVSNDFTELTEYKTVAEAKLFDGSETVIDYGADDANTVGDESKTLEDGDKRYDFTYSVETSSKAISVSYYVLATGTAISANGDLDSDVDGHFWAKTTLGTTTVKDALVLLLSNATGESVTSSYFFVKETSGKMDSVGYAHNASKKDANATDSIDNYKVVWTIATSTVAKA